MGLFFTIWVLFFGAVYVAAKVWDELGKRDPR